MTYHLIIVPPQFVDRAWKEGAAKLSEACDKSGGEITGDQLKMILSRGERQLIRIDLDGAPVGWGVTRIDQMPNVRALHITDLYAPGNHMRGTFDLLAQMAREAGCSEVRCCAAPAQARLYMRNQQWEPLYTTLRVTL